MDLGRIVLVAAIAVRFCFADSLADALRTGRFQDALQICDELLRSQPRDPRVWTGRGVALVALGRDADGISSFEKALGHVPDSLPALKGAVEAGYRSRDPRTSALLGRLLQLEPANGVAHAIAGVLAFEAGDCGLAVPHFEKARSETAANERALSVYGMCLVAVQRSADSVPIFAEILERHPESARARFNLGYAQLVAGKGGEAVTTLEPFASGPKPEPESLNLLAAAEAAAGRLESAVAHLQQAIRIAPEDERNYVDLVALCIQHESEDTAASIVDAGLRNLPKSARLHTIHGILQAQLGRHDEAAVEFDLANRLDPDSQYGAAGLGVLYTETRQERLASVVLRERLRKTPGDAILNLLLAQALVQEGAEPGSAGFTDAVRALKLSTSAKPELARAHSLLGKLYVTAGDYARAVDELRLGAKYDPSDRMAFSQLVIALRRLGRDQEAAETVAALKRIVFTEAQPKANYKRILIAPAPPGPSPPLERR